MPNVYSSCICLRRLSVALLYTRLRVTFVHRLSTALALCVESAPIWIYARPACRSIPSTVDYTQIKSTRPLKYQMCLIESLRSLGQHQRIWEDSSISFLRQIPMEVGRAIIWFRRGLSAIQSHGTQNDSCISNCSSRPNLNVPPSFGLIAV